MLNVSATYLLNPTGSMYKRPATAADVRWYVYDGLGSVVGEVDVNGTLIAEKKHDVYGIRRGTVGTQKSKHGFVGGLGHYSDEETGLIYMRARYYDPAIGRFISEDPRQVGINWFTYCRNSPTNMGDYSGNEPLINVTMLLGLIRDIDGMSIALREYYASFLEATARDYTQEVFELEADAWKHHANAAQIEEEIAKMQTESTGSAVGDLLNQAKIKLKEGNLLLERRLEQQSIAGAAQYAAMARQCQVTAWLLRMT